MNSLSVHYSPSVTSEALSLSATDNFHQLSTEASKRLEIKPVASLALSSTLTLLPFLVACKEASSLWNTAEYLLISQLMLRAC